MDDNTIQDRIKSAPELQQLQSKLRDTLRFHADSSAQFAPILIVTIISAVIQIIIACRKEKKSDTDIAAVMKDLRAVPPRKLIRLRRQMRMIWQEHCAATGQAVGIRNPILEALYEISDTVTDADINGLFAAASDT
jgi:hypothetical protein